MHAPRRHNIRYVILVLVFTACLAGWLAVQDLPQGLHARYYANAIRHGPPATSGIDKEITTPRVMSRKGVPSGTFSAHWRGWIYAPRTGSYTFHLSADGFAFLQVAGKTLRLAAATPGHRTRLTLPLDRGVYPMEVTYARKGNPFFIDLNWSFEQQPRQKLAGIHLLYAPTSWTRVYLVDTFAAVITMLLALCGLLLLVPLLPGIARVCLDCVLSLVVSALVLDMLLWRLMALSLLGLTWNESTILLACLILPAVWLIKGHIGHRDPSMRAFWQTQPLRYRLQLRFAALFLPQRLVGELAAGRSNRFLPAPCAWLVLLILVFASCLAGSHKGLLSHTYWRVSFNRPHLLTTADRSLDHDTKLRRYPQLPWNRFQNIRQGWLYAPRPGKYRFRLQGDDYAKLEVSGCPCLESSINHYMNYEPRVAYCSLEKGWHPLRLTFSQTVGNAWLAVWWRPPGHKEQPLPFDNLYQTRLPSWGLYLARGGLPALCCWLAALLSAVGLCLNLLRLLATCRQFKPLARFHRFIRRKRTAMGMLIACAVLIRLLFMLAANPVLMPDSGQYYWQMQRILAGDFTSHDIFRTPGYSLFLAPFFLFGETELAGQAVVAAQHLLALVSGLLFYLLARRLVRPVAAFYASLLYLCHSLLLFYELVIQSEVVFMCLFSLACYVFVRAWEKRSLPLFALTALLLAGLTLVRPIAQYLVVLFVLCVWLNRMPVRRRLFATLVMAGVFILGLLPWMWVNQQTYGFWGITREMGTNICFRVYEIDHQRPVPFSAHPTIKYYYTQALFNQNGCYFGVKDRLVRERGYSLLRVDREMMAFGIEGLRAYPCKYLRLTALRWLRLFSVSNSTVHTCYQDGLPYLCCRTMQGRSFPAFSNQPKPGRPLLKKCIHLFVSRLHLPARWLSILALAGALIAWLQHRRKRPLLLLLLLMVLYFTTIVALLNFPEDRYRLPADPFLLMLACYSLAWLAAPRPRTPLGMPIGNSGAQPLHAEGYDGWYVPSIRPEQVMDLLRRAQSGEGRVIHAARNRIVVLDGPCGPVAIKLFAVPSVPRRLESLVHLSKAARSFWLGHGLLAADFPTALPLAFLEQRPQGLLGRSVLICRYLENMPQIRAITLPEGRYHQRLNERFITLLAAYLRRLHTKGFMHRDMSDGNILVDFCAQDPRFFLLDLNRIHPRGYYWLFAGIKGITRLSIPRHYQRLFVSEYLAGGYPPWLGWLLYRFIKSSFEAKLAIKRTLRRRAGIKK